MNRVLLVLAAAALTAGCGGSESGDAKKPAARPALTVATTTPQRAELQVTVVANGNVTAWQEAIVGAEVSGLRIAEVRADVGDIVRKGATLATFAAETVRADLAEARATVAQAEANLADATANADRARRLQGTGAMSAAESQKLLAGEKVAQAQVQAARAALQTREVRLGQTTLEAPDDGIISSRTATVGAVVAAGTELFRLIRQGRLEWRAEVTSAELGRIAPGTVARITTASGAQLEGRVRSIGPTVDPQTRNATVYVDLKSAAGAGGAKPGMFARGEFQLGAAQALTVPQSALVVREGFSYVFRVEPDQRVAQVKVQPGRIVGDRLEILSGLDPQATIVASGGSFLQDGDLVRVSNAQAPAQPRGEPAKK